MPRNIPKYIQEYHAAGGATNREAVERFMKTQVEYQRRAIKGWQTRLAKGWLSPHQRAAEQATLSQEALYQEQLQQQYEEANRQTIAAEINFNDERQQFLDMKVRNFYNDYITQLPPEVRDDLMKYFNTDINNLSDIISRIEQNIGEIEAALYRYEIYQGTPQAKEELQACLVKIATILNGGTISEEENIRLTQLGEQFAEDYESEYWGVF